jgi:hypothetical protein
MFFLFEDKKGTGHRRVCQLHFTCEVVTGNVRKFGYNEEQISCNHGSKKSVLASLTRTNTGTSQIRIDFIYKYKALEVPSMLNHT